MPKKILIVGGVAGGSTAATRLRRLSEEDEIIVFERGKYVSFANCGLPYYIGGTITDRSKLFAQTPEGLKNKYNLDVRVHNEVVWIDREKRTIGVKNIQTNEEYTETYTHLILSPGAVPFKPPIEGLVETTNLFTLRNVPDTDKMKAFIEEKKPQNAVIIGGGFIGLEMAENFHKLGMHVTIVENADQILGPLDKEMAAIVEAHLIDYNIDLILADAVKSFKDEGKKVVTNSGKEIKADLILLSIGVKPENALAKNCGLEMGERGGIKVNNKLQTNDPNIFAIGDVIETNDVILNMPTQIPLAWPANRQGRVVADVINGKNKEYKGTLGNSILKVFDIDVAITGLNEKVLKKRNIPYQAMHLIPSDHANYYPGATPFYIKLLFNKETGKIYGAQLIGDEGVDKRIDVISTAILTGMKAQDLQELELAYAPPFSSAKDPVNYVGYIAENIMDGLLDLTQWHEIDNLDKEKNIILDIGELAEREIGHIEGSIHIPLYELRDRLNELPKDKKIHTYCQVGLRGYIACRILRNNGFDANSLSGGYKTYIAAKRDYNVDKTDIVTNQLGQSIKSTISNNIDTNMTNYKLALEVDACGLQCPGPIVQAKKAVDSLKEGEIVKIIATDPGFLIDGRMWATKTGNTFLSSSQKDGKYTVFIQKGASQASPDMDNKIIKNKDGGVTLVVFSGDLDKAIASMIIANGAVAFGKPVSIFFTFWGLNILRKPYSVKVKKSLLESIFGKIMPRGVEKLGLSKMNMFGMGAMMIKYIMNKKNVDSLDKLVKDALANNVKFIACTMSMDIMGIKKEELIDGIDYAGVATYLGDAMESSVDLFI